jgi:glycosyltransferase involved in cell wall biosynthesis
MIKKIAIDVSPLSDGNSVRGVGHYTSHLVKALQQEVKTNSDYKNFKIDLIDDPQKLNNSYDLIHYPYFDPFKLTLPNKKNIPTIVTVHDLIPREFKKHFPVGIRGEIKWFLQKNKLKKSDYIIAVSNYSKYVIKDIVNYPAEKIFVTHEAADSDFKIYKDQTQLEFIRKKYHLPDKFILFVGDINWNKNIPSLVKACEHLQYPLVIVGSAATRSNIEDHPWNKDLIWLQLQKSKNLILTGFVSDEELPLFYNLATIYCQPSFAEGFGLPLVQAMQSGCPIACSDKTCLPEIVEDAALLFNPYDQKDIENILKSFWENKKLLLKYSELGLERSKIFKWKLTALQTLALYKLALIDEK